MKAGDDAILRHRFGTRLVHWLIAADWVLLFASGLALFHPGFYWISDLFGGGSFMRVLHPFLGAGLFVLFFGYAGGIWRENLLLASDRKWLKDGVAIVLRKKEVAVEGKYNAGQKVVFWLALLSIAGLLVSGIFIWRPYFADKFGADARRIAIAVHVFCSFLMFAVIGVHVYAAFWTKGANAAMLRGYVSRKWAQLHHPGWYRTVAGTKDEETKAG
jgi:formate dehydrogenase subunit gamma